MNIVICPSCLGHGKIIWPQGDNQIKTCKACGGQGRIIKITKITYEELPENLKPAYRWMQGL